MKLKARIDILLLAGLALASVMAATAATAAAPAAAGKRPVVAVIPKGTTHEFWKTVHAGAVKAGREEDVEARHAAQSTWRAAPSGRRELQPVACRPGLRRARVGHPGLQVEFEARLRPGRP